MSARCVKHTLETVNVYLKINDSAELKWAVKNSKCFCGADAEYLIAAP